MDVHCPASIRACRLLELKGCTRCPPLRRRRRRLGGGAVPTRAMAALGRAAAYGVPLLEGRKTSPASTQRCAPCISGSPSRMTPRCPIIGPETRDRFRSCGRHKIVHTTGHLRAFCVDVWPRDWATRDKPRLRGQQKMPICRQFEDGSDGTRTRISLPSRSGSLGNGTTNQRQVQAMTDRLDETQHASLWDIRVLPPQGVVPPSTLHGH
jgi:hypothetical protein